jgi:nucleotide-binding universal stress UspA family protein
MYSRSAGMVYLKKILVPTDLSGHSLAALEYAQSLSLLYASRVFLLHVEEHARHRAEEPAAALLAEFVLRHADPDLRLTQVVRSGHPAAEIVRFSRDERIDLIVLATHGRTGVAHALLGSVAEKVIRHSPVPVLTVKPAEVRENLLRDEDIENELHLR